MTSAAQVVAPSWMAGATEIPLEARSAVAIREWEEVAIDAFWFRPGALEDELLTVGLPEKDAADAARILREGREEQHNAVSSYWDEDDNRYEGAPPDKLAEAERITYWVEQSIIERLRDWWSGRQVVVDQRDLVQIKVALFILSAANTRGSTAEYESKTGRETEIGWSVEIFGTGASRSTEYTTSVTSTLGAEAGQACVIFLPVTIAAEQVRIVSSEGRTIGRGVRLDPSPNRRSKPLPSGATLPSSALPPPGDLVQTYPLGEYAGPPAKYEYMYEQSWPMSVKAGFKAFDVDISLNTKSTMTGSVTLTYELPGGHEYTLHRIAEADGLIWSA